MRSHNSRIGFYTQLFTALYHDVVGANSSQSDVERDLHTMESRATHEGLSFFTETLPSLGKAVMLSLSTGTRLQFRGFKTSKGTDLPAFCRTIFSQVFRSDGFPHFWEVEPPGLKEVEGSTRPGCREASHHSREATALALRALLQLTMCFYKLNVPYTNEKETRVIEEFKRTDQEVPTSFTSGYQRIIISKARKLIARVLNTVDPLSGSPRHGPGAVATGEKTHQKHHFRRFYRRLNSMFPYDEWFFYNSSHLCDSLQELQSMEDLEAGTAKVVLVPKDSRGPRLISCEPLEYQWIQQSLMAVLVSAIESHPLTRGHVNFTDQTINRRLALESSLSNEMVTLDMKEASDRVGLALVKELFPPRWYDALYASRTPQTRLPSGEIVHMKKFAPMGSAVCFPVEALVFWALSVAALSTHGFSTEESRANIYVYGDDIISHRDHYPVVCSTLEEFGLKLNSNKCCVASFFRESCGMEAYLGYPVTPTKIRRTWSQRRKSGNLASYVSYSNDLWDKGFVRAALYIEDRIRQQWRCGVPTLPGRSGVIAFIREATAISQGVRPWRRRYNRRLQRLEIQGYSSVPTPILAEGSGWSLLLREHAGIGKATIDESRGKLRPLTHEDASPYEKILSRLPSGRYAMVNRDKLKITWTPAPH